MSAGARDIRHYRAVADSTGTPQGSRFGLACLALVGLGGGIALVMVGRPQILVLSVVLLGTLLAGSFFLLWRHRQQEGTPFPAFSMGLCMVVPIWVLGVSSFFFSLQATVLVFGYLLGWLIGIALANLWELRVTS